MYPDYDGRIRVEEMPNNFVVQVNTIPIGEGVIDLNNGLLIRVGFNHHLPADLSTNDGVVMYPFLSTNTAQIVFLHRDTLVTRKNIKVVVE